MHRAIRLATRFTVASLVATDCWAAADFTWPTAIPEEAGFDSTALVQLFDYAREHQTPVHSVQIVRHGKLVLDAYFYPYDGSTRHDVASVTKSITSTLIGLAIERGHLHGVKQPALSFFADRSVAGQDARKKEMTLEHLLTMQAGWDCGFEPNEARLAEMRRSSDWIQFILDLPMVAKPGTRWAYCSGNCHVLSAILTRTTRTNALAFARRELFEPLGIQDVAWPADARGHSHGWGDLQLHPRDMAKVGQLFLQKGRWNGRQIISEKSISIATRGHVARTSNADGYGYFWWVKGKDHPSMFEAVGRGGQRINVWPAKAMVLVFTGGGFEPGDLAKFILRALKSDKALPANLEGARQLHERIAAAAKAPSGKPPAKLPVMAAAISGRTFNVAQNTLGLSNVMLKFSDIAEAQAEMVVTGKRLRFAVGLDSVERFSTNDLLLLPVASKGHWIDAKSFFLRLDLLGGINCYNFRFTFSDAGTTATINLDERTGLHHEVFEAAAN